jgi:hypothetical protein
MRLPFTRRLLVQNSKYLILAQSPRKTSHIVEQMIRTNTIMIEGYDPVSVNIEGFTNPHRDRSHQFRLLSFQWLNSIIDARGDEEVDSFLELIWKNVIQPMVALIESSGNKMEPFFMAFHDHATALRTMVFCKLFVLSCQEIKHELEDYLRTCILFLEDETYYSSLTNHGWDQAISLIIASHLLNEPSQLGLDRFRTELSHAFTTEGVHVENSPHYHIHMVNNLIYTSHLFEEQCITENLVREMRIIGERAVLFYLMIQRENKTTPLIGDSYRIPPKLNPLTIKFIEDVSKKITPTDFKGFPESGYGIWKYYCGERSVHLTIKNGTLSRYHRHDDDLSITLNVGGEDVFIDGGLYKYNEDDQYRIFLRSSRAHSTIVNENDICNRIINPRLLNEVNEQLNGFKGTSSMWSDSVFSRTITRKSPEVFVFTDIAESNSASHLNIRFHTTGKVSIEDKKVVSITCGSASVRLYWEDNQNFDISEIQVTTSKSIFSESHGVLSESKTLELKIPYCKFQYFLQIS